MHCYSGNLLFFDRFFSIYAFNGQFTSSTERRLYDAGLILMMGTQIPYAYARGFRYTPNSAD
jgi:hypothetical protein